MNPMFQPLFERFERMPLPAKDGCARALDAMLGLWEQSASAGSFGSDADHFHFFEAMRWAFSSDPAAAKARFDKGLLWDHKDNFLELSFAELRKRAEEVHGGVGVLAADFDELSRYGFGDVKNRRDRLSRILSGAEEKDYPFIAEVLSAMLRRPWTAAEHAAWCIHLMRTGADEFDVDRAAKIMNELYVINPYAASVLMRALAPFVEQREPEPIYTRDLLVRSGVLNEMLVLDANPASVFISYAREDDAVMERVFQGLSGKAHNVWKDNHALLAGQAWEDEIRARLESTDFVVVGVSKASMRNRGFFRIELEWALERVRRQEQGTFLLPLLIEDVPHKLIPPELLKLHLCDTRFGLDAALTEIDQSITRSRSGWQYRSL